MTLSPASSAARPRWETSSPNGKPPARRSWPAKTPTRAATANGPSRASNFSSPAPTEIFRPHHSTPKTHTMKPSNCQLWLSLAFAAFTLTASAASVTLTDSIVSLATNGTKYYTFVDPVSGHFVQVALTMSVHSSDPVDVFTSLDGDTRLGIGNPSIGGDGNHIDTSEGVNFAASVVTVSSGVAANSIGFRIVSLGLRDTGGGNPYWFSYASNSNSLPLSGEAVYSLDSASAGLFGASYLGYLRGVPGSGTYQITDVASGGQGLTLNLTFTATANSDPRTNSWLTTYTSRYARIYTNDAAKTAGNAVTTWNNGTQNQASPAYAGVQAVYSSSSWVYLQTSGLGQHTMGPWLNGSFPNLPKNQNVLYRIPRTPTVHTATNLTGLGAIGYFVDGVAMFDSRDAFYWNGTTEVTGTGSWNREAYVNEGATFDPGYAHQENTGTHHYHA
ncbi:MAG: YHYH protein, partial [Verrucomicrobia bacterium]